MAATGKSKQIKEAGLPGGGAKGGSGHMSGKNGAKPQTPMQTASKGGTGGGKFAKGGNTPMFGKGAAAKAPAGLTMKLSQKGGK